MSLLSKLIGGPVVAPIQAIGDVAETIWGSKERKLSHAEFMAGLAANADLAQVELNKIEAQHRSIFVAGWRPMVGWICALGLSFPFLFNPILQWWTCIQEVCIDGPALPVDDLSNLVFALLGLGAYRTFEKVQGKAK
jgi:hypothetical protein